MPLQWILRFSILKFASFSFGLYLPAEKKCMHACIFSHFKCDSLDGVEHGCKTCLYSCVTILISGSSLDWHGIFFFAREMFNLAFVCHIIWDCTLSVTIICRMKVLFRITLQSPENAFFVVANSQPGLNRPSSCLDFLLVGEAKIPAWCSKLLLCSFASLLIMNQDRHGFIHRIRWSYFSPYSGILFSHPSAPRETFAWPERCFYFPPLMLAGSAVVTALLLHLGKSLRLRRKPALAPRSLCQSHACTCLYILVSFHNPTLSILK